MSPLPAPRQASILARRYAACLLGDLGTLVLLVAQAPVIGALCVVVWRSVERDTPSLWFVLCLSALWFGCIGACREIVRERAILERERFFGVSLPAYVASKVVVLGLLGGVQVLLLQGAVEWHLSLRGPYLLQTLALWGASLAGTGLGLLVSALSKTQERAVGWVPLLLLPQILFSEMAVPRDTFREIVTTVEKAMPVHWAFEVFKEAARDDPSWGRVLACTAALFLYGAALLVMTTAALWPRREV